MCAGYRRTPLPPAVDVAPRLWYKKSARLVPDRFQADRVGNMDGRATNTTLIELVRIPARSGAAHLTIPERLTRLAHVFEMQGWL